MTDNVKQLIGYTQEQITQLIELLKKLQLTEDYFAAIAVINSGAPITVTIKPEAETITDAVPE
jgi:hypothetical protein